MSDHTYKCASAKATAYRIWNADFYHGSYNELVESKDPDRVVASVGLSELSGPDRRLNMVVTLFNHPWGQEIADILIEEIQLSDPPLFEWSISYKNCSWTITMSFRG
jgi:hypothetical protein